MLFRSGFVEESEQLKRAKLAEEDRMREAEEEVEQLRRRLRDVQTMVRVAEQEHVTKSKEIEEAGQLQRYTQGEAETLMDKNKQLQDDNNILANKMNELESQLKSSHQKLDELSLMVDEKEKEIKAARSGSAYADNKELVTRAELRKYKQDNENLQTLLDRYRNDAELHKKLREEEAVEKYKLEEEKERLAREAVKKDMEARDAKKELERYQDSHGRLLEERIMTAQELDALKEHAMVLESQNVNVRFY